MVQDWAQVIRQDGQVSLQPCSITAEAGVNSTFVIILAAKLPNNTVLRSIPDIAGSRQSALKGIVGIFQFWDVGFYPIAFL
ncbi:MAG: hypothetical protein OHK0023_10280 [Anaerolineae bacterium]